jgi:hypothetical protein
LPVTHADHIIASSTAHVVAAGAADQPVVAPVAGCVVVA